MKKILNEWRAFLKESSEKDDIKVATRVTAAIAPMSLASDEGNNFLRANKERAKRIISGYLNKDPHALRLFALNPAEDMVTVGGRNYEFPSYDFYERMQEAFKILDDPSSGYDFSYFNEEQDFSDNPNPGAYGEKEHSGGAGEAGLALPNRAFEEEPRDVLDLNIKRWLSFYSALWTGDPEQIRQSRLGVIPALEYFISLYRMYMPYDEKYIDKLGELANKLGSSTSHEPIQKDTKSEYEIAKEELEALKKLVEELTLLSGKTPTSPIQKKQIAQAKVDLPVKSKEYTDLKRKVRGMRDRRV